MYYRNESLKQSPEHLEAMSGVIITSREVVSPAGDTSPHADLDKFADYFNPEESRLPSSPVAAEVGHTALAANVEIADLSTKTLSTITSAEGMAPLNLASLTEINSSLESFDTGHTTVTEVPVIISSAERPISARRVTVEKPVAHDADGNEVNPKLFEGRLSKLADLREATVELRGDRKRIIEVQKQAMDTIVSTARSERNEAAGKRVGSVIHNNLAARVFGERADQRKARRAELTEQGFDAIADARQRKNESRNRDPERKSVSDRFRRAQVRLNAAGMARAEVRDASRGAMRAAKTELSEARDRLSAQKTRRSRLQFRPYRARTSLGAHKSAGIKSAYEGAGSYLGMSEQQKKANEEKRAREYMEKQQKRLTVKKSGSDGKLRSTQIDPKARYINRAASLQRTNRRPVYGPPRPE